MTELALRGAAVQLISERGYDATSTDDIARAAGVSPRTFFNYFPTKESVVLLPDDFVAPIIEATLRSRPLDEDVVTSLGLAAMAVMETIGPLADATADAGSAASVAASVRLLFTERSLRQIFFERRLSLEDVAWAVLRERGVAADDVAARAAVATVITLAYLGLRLWAEGGAAEPLPAVAARCLRLAPDPSRLAAGLG